MAQNLQYIVALSQSNSPLSFNGISFPIMSPGPLKSQPIIGSSPNVLYQSEDEGSTAFSAGRSCSFLAPRMRRALVGGLTVTDEDDAVGVFGVVVLLSFGSGVALEAVADEAAAGMVAVLLLL